MRVSRHIQWGIGATLLAFLLTFSSAASASAKKNFCKVEQSIDIPGKAKLKDSIAVVTLSLTGIKAVLSAYLPVDQMRFANQKAAESASRTVKMIKPLTMLNGALKAFAKSFVPYSERLAKALDVPDAVAKKYMKGAASFSTGGNRIARSQLTAYFKFFKAYVYAYRGWLVLATAATAVRLSALGVCKQATVIVPICTKNKKQCGVEIHNDLPDVSGVLGSEGDACASQSRELKIIKDFISLSNKNNGKLSKISKQMLPVAKFFNTWAPKLKKIHSVVKGAESGLKSFGSLMKGLNKVMKPIDAGARALKSLMEKQICMKLKFAGKKTKKCFRLKNLAKDVKKYSKKTVKPLFKMADKLIDPVVKKMLNKLSIPGMGKVTGALQKMGRSLSELSNFSKEFNKLKNLQLNQFTKELNQLKSELSRLK